MMEILFNCSNLPALQAHAQLPILQEEPEEQEIAAEDFEQPAQEQVRAHIIMSQMQYLQQQFAFECL